MKKLFAILIPFLMMASAESAPPTEKVVNLEKVPWEQANFKGLTVKRFPGDLMSMNIARYAAGTLMPLHVHPNEQIFLVRSGKYKITIEGREHILMPDDLLIIPPYVVHVVEALVDSEHLEVFAPGVLKQTFLK
jgi:quercetin dioxygenase-like cupin family protein